ncbi:MAG: DUF2065 domain-containing protein [Marinibacterium sp.]|nr:DUF2065 domain-containing protein [Marinibacterium sp.]
MSIIFLALGLVLILEGLAWALAPSIIEQVLELLRSMPESARRQIGLLAMVGGFMLVWLAFWIGI